MRLFVAVLALTVPALNVLAQTVHAQRPTASAPADAIIPFKIQVPNATLADLKQRLSRTRFADDFGDPGWDYGTNPAYLKGLIEYWRDKYDWRTHEKRLNEFDQFKTNIDGLTIHFIHQRSGNANAMPLLLLNGWPSSIVEYAKVIGPLTDPVRYGGRAEDSFHVVIPSMPGYGFSDKPRERGYHPERIAGLWVKLMARLGYTRYGAHGSDWGGGIATRMALNDPTHVAALHLVTCGGAPVPSALNAAQPASPPSASRVNSTVDQAHNLGYREIQSTKPQTLGPALSDSPAGLASWIVEKWFGWGHHDGDIEKAFTKDELLTNVMIYWVTNTGPSSARLYYESRHPEGRLIAGLTMPIEGRVTVPTGCGGFPWQFDRLDVAANTNYAEARKGAERLYNVVHFTTMPRGGHFPAFEQPAMWVDDIRTFFRGRIP